MFSIKSRSVAALASIPMAAALSMVCAAPASAGVINNTPCSMPGQGTFGQLRLSDAEGSSITLNPGTVYNGELDFTPSTNAVASKLLLNIDLAGQVINVLDTILDNSSLTQGQPVTVRFTFVPNDALSGQTVDIKVRVEAVSLQNPLQVNQICRQFTAQIA